MADEYCRPGQGIRQWVAIARAPAAESDLWLLDEPFAGLDFALRMRTIGFLRRLLDVETRTAGYVTHDAREALVLGDRLVLLSARPAYLWPAGASQGRLAVGGRSCARSRPR